MLLYYLFTKKKSILTSSYPNLTIILTTKNKMCACIAMRNEAYVCPIKKHKKKQKQKKKIRKVIDNKNNENEPHVCGLTYSTMFAVANTLRLISVTTLTMAPIPSFLTIACCHVKKSVAYSGFA